MMVSLMPLTVKVSLPALTLTLSELSESVMALLPATPSEMFFELPWSEIVLLPPPPLRVYAPRAVTVLPFELSVTVSLPRPVKMLALTVAAALLI